MNELYPMLVAIFLPLLISWLFKRTGWKWIRLTYLISGLLVVFIPLSARLALAAIVFLQPAGPATLSLGALLAEMSGSIAILLFMTLFFQYIFNRTVGLGNI